MKARPYRPVFESCFRNRSAASFELRCDLMTSRIVEQHMVRLARFGAGAPHARWEEHTRPYLAGHVSSLGSATELTRSRLSNCRLSRMQEAGLPSLLAAFGAFASLPQLGNLDFRTNAEFLVSDCAPVADLGLAADRRPGAALRHCMHFHGSSMRARQHAFNRVALRLEHSVERALLC